MRYTIREYFKVNLKDYIESGIIESYVMGLASDQKGLNLNNYVTQHPELVAARRKFEESTNRLPSTGLTDSSRG